MDGTQLSSFGHLRESVIIDLAQYVAFFQGLCDISFVQLCEMKRRSGFAAFDGETLHDEILTSGYLTGFQCRYHVENVLIVVWSATLHCAVWPSFQGAH